MILSNRKLKLIIIALLLFIFATFLCMLDPKAETLAIEPNNSYCPNGSYFREVHNDKWYYGCTFGDYSYAKSYVGYNNMENGYYDISGYIYFLTDTIQTINMSANSTSCFITSENRTGPEPFLTYYCFNVEINNNSLSLGVDSFQTAFRNNNNRIGFGRDFTLNPHFDKSTNNTITNIQNNTNNINTSINDSTIDNNQTSTDTTSWSNMNASNGTITNLLTLPITLLQAIVNGLQTTCSSFSLGTLFNTNIVLPCINVGTLIGSGLWATIDILFSGFMILAIGKKLIKIFNDFTNLKTNQMDEIYGGGSK